MAWLNSDWGYRFPVTINKSKVGGLSQDLVAYYKLDETTGTIVYDAHNDYDSTSGSATNNQTGLIDKCLYLNNNAIYFGEDSDTMLSGNDFTVSFWINSSYASGSTKYILSKGDSTVGSTDFIFGYNTGEVTLTVRAGGITKTVSRTVTAGLSGQGWVHIVGIVNGQTAYLYEQNDPFSRSSNSVALGADRDQNNGELVIGKSNWLGNNALTAYIDEIAIFNRALSTDELDELYNSASGKSYSSITNTTLTDYNAYINLDDVSDTTFWSNVETDGADIIITADDGTTSLPRELVDIDTTGQTGEIHIKLPTFTASADEKVYLYFDNSNAYAEGNLGEGLTENLEIYYKLEESAGTSVTDSSGNSNTGTYNGVGHSATGKIDDCYDFDGIDDFIDTGYDVNFNTGGAHSFSMWVNFNNASSTGLFGNWVDNSEPRGSGMYVNNGQLVWFDGSNNHSVSGLTLASAWHHIVVIAEQGGLLKIYLDGIEKLSESANHDNTTERLWIGKQYLGEFDGLIDEFAMWTRRLTVDEVTNLYNSTNALQYEAFTDYNWRSAYDGVYHLQEASGNALDSSQKLLDGTYNGATYGATGQIEDAYDYDGTTDYTYLDDHENIEGSNVATFSCWIKPDNISSQRFIYSTDNGTDSTDTTLSLRFWTGDTFISTWSGTNSTTLGSNSITASNYFTVGTWAYVTTILTATHTILMVDNEIVSNTARTETGETIRSSTKEVTLGRLGSYSAYYFDGIIDEARLSAEAIDTNEAITSYNNQASSSTFYTIGGTEIETLPPTTQATAVGFTSIADNSVTTSWTRGNGANCAVFIKEGTTGTAAPVDSIDYTPNTVFGSGDQIGTTGWYCIYDGTGITVDVTGLTHGTDYQVHVCEYNGAGVTTHYNITSATDNPDSFQTTISPPSTQASSLVASNVTYKDMTINWTNGNGNNVAVFAKATDTGTAVPVDGTAYTASDTFGSGDQIGTTGWYCVYNGTGTTEDIIVLDESTTYRYQAFAYNVGVAGTEDYNINTATDNPLNQATPAQQPTVQVTNIIASSVAYNGATLDWTNGNGESTVVFAKQTSTGTTVPEDGTTYNADANFGDGTQLGSGWFCIYKGVGTQVNLTGLVKVTGYRVQAFTYTGEIGDEDFLTTTATLNPINFTTADSEPSVQASNLNYSSVLYTTATLSWTSGDGANRVVFVKQDTTGTPVPVDTAAYTANTSFGSGTQIGTTGWYCVYNGAGTTVDIEGLTSNTIYRSMVLEYGPNLDYLLDTATDNPLNVQTADSEPSTQASNIIYSNTSVSKTTIDWTDGSATNRAVFMKATDTGTPIPVDGTTYTANTSFGTGDQIGTTGWYCVYVGIGSQVSVTGLNGDTTYRTMVLEYGPTTDYLLDTATNNPLNVTTLDLEPLIPARNLVYSSTTDAATTLNWDHQETVSQWKFDESLEDTRNANDGVLHVDAIAYYPYNGNANDESDNSNNGTLSTATVIDDCSNTLTFSNTTEALFSVNTTTYQETSAMNIYSTVSPTNNNMGFDVNFSSTDLSNKIVNYYLYIKNQTALDKIDYLQSYASDGVGWNVWAVENTSLVVGWNVISIDISNPESEEGGGADETIINKFRVRVYKNSTSDSFSEGDIIVDHFNYGTPMKTKDRFGVDSKAYEFKNSYIDTGTNVADFKHGTNSFTIAGWFNSHDRSFGVGETPALFGVRAATTTSRYSLSLDDDSLYIVPYFFILDDSGNSVGQKGNSLNYDEWHHVVMVVDRANNKGYMYANGVLQSAFSGGIDISSITGDISPQGLSLIGAQVHGNTANFNGPIDEVLILDYALNANEATSLYESSNLHDLNDIYVTGKIDHAADFFTEIVYSDIGGSITMDHEDSSISFWAYIDAKVKAGGMNIMAEARPTSGTEHIHLYSDGSTARMFFMEPSTNSKEVWWAEPATPLSTGWHHFAFTMDTGGAPKLYVDNVDQGTPDSPTQVVTDDFQLRYIAGGRGYDQNYSDAVRTRIEDLRIYASTLDTTEIGLIYNSGSGTYKANSDNMAVFVKATTTGTPLPIDGTEYTANTTFGSGGQIGTSGWYCVYDGTGTQVEILGLSGKTDYRTMVIEYGGDIGEPDYLLNTGVDNPENVETLYSEPTTQASLLTFTDVGDEFMTINWTNGNGLKRAVFGFEGTTGTAAAVDDIDYAPNPYLGLGDQIGTTGWYCLYNGTGTSVTIDGLTRNTYYRFMAVEYNG